jgi:hypothetical protein
VTASVYGGAGTGVSSRSIRGDALLASVKPGGGGWRVADDLYRLASAAIVSEAALERAVLVERGRLRPGLASRDGALRRLTHGVETEPKPKKVQYWLEETAPWAQHAIGEELAAAGLARLVSRRFLRVFLPQPHLEILDQRAQDEAVDVVRETLEGHRPALPDAALLTVLAGPLQNDAGLKPRQARRRFRELQASLPEHVQVVLRAYHKWEIRGAADG